MVLVEMVRLVFEQVGVTLHEQVQLEGDVEELEHELLLVGEAENVPMEQGRVQEQGQELEHGQGQEQVLEQVGLAEQQGQKEQRLLRI